MKKTLLLGGCMLMATAASGAPDLYPDVSQMSRIWPGESRMVNALWIENAQELQMGNGREKVLVADLRGPAVITMFHFAMPATLTLDRGIILRIYWDGETSPSVECPFVDFFADPNGALDRVDSAFVNKRRGWNAYFPMPFAKSARIEIANENPRYCAAWDRAPVYSYVHYRTVKRFPKDTAYFHATWRQKTLLLGREHYPVFETTGRGHFVGWNMTIRSAAGPGLGYPVDENEWIYLDGETEPAIEWQGLEDAFGFSWGFPESGNTFPLTGYQPFYKNGAAAFRFLINDRISFQKSIRMTVGFGKNENQYFHDQFSAPGTELQLSSVAYWYQQEPHAPFPAMPRPEDRHPAFMAAGKCVDPAPYLAQNLAMALNCGAKTGDIEFLKDGWDFRLRSGFSYAEFPGEINHCWADNKCLQFDIICPINTKGTLKLFFIDADNFCNGRKQSVTVAGRHIGIFENFQQGRWLEIPITARDTGESRIAVAITNLKPEVNAVLSLVRFIE